MLQYGDNNVYVALLKLRLNNIRAGLISAGVGCPWGTSGTSYLFDNVLWLNVGCFQQTYGIPINHVYNSVMDSKMKELEALLGIHY